MYCPRCGVKMTGGVCDECGFPVNAKVIVYKKIYDMCSK